MYLTPCVAVAVADPLCWRVACQVRVQKTTRSRGSSTRNLKLSKPRPLNGILTGLGGRKEVSTTKQNLTLNLWAEVGTPRPRVHFWPRGFLQSLGSRHPAAAWEGL